MVRYAVGYQSRAFVTFGEPIALKDYDPESRRDVMALAHLTRDTIGRLYKVLPTAIVAAAMRPGITRRELEARGAGGDRHRRGRRRQPVGHLGTGGRGARGRTARDPQHRSRRTRRPVPRPRTHRPALLRPHPASSARRPAPSASHALMRVVSRAVFQALAGSRSMKTLASRYGLRSDDAASPDGSSPARRSTTPSPRPGGSRRPACTQTLDYLGESVATMAEADRATRAYLGILEEIAASGIGRNVSLKLTQLGLTVDRATCVDNLRRILDGAAPHEFFVRIDMEDSRYTQVTLDVFETMWQQGYRNAGMVVQSYLPRSMDDVRRMNALGRARAPGEGRLPRAAKDRVSEEGAGRRRVRRDHAAAADRRHPARHRDPRSRDAGGDDRVRRATRDRRPTGSSSRCSTASGVTCRRGWRGDGYRVRVYVPFGRGLVPLLHAPAGRAPGERGIRGPKPAPREIVNRALCRGPPTVRKRPAPPKSSGPAATHLPAVSLSPASAVTI